ncbi:MAG: hypothetical protein IT406_00900 [Candidatus Yanofskybacteria bacterium]|nr:hypothetical protein [Candidatus Yanofskybacteria bacterium]
MSTRRHWLPAAIIAIGIAVACTQPAPTPSSPSSIGDAVVAGGQAIEAPVSAPSPSPEADCSGERALDFISVLEFSIPNGTAKVKNNGTCPHWVGLALYDLREGLMKQYFVAEDFKEVPPGATARFAVVIPDDVCLYQSDLLAGISEAVKANGTFPNQAGHLVDTDAFGGNFGNNAACKKPKDPPTPPPPPPPVCSGVGTPSFSFDKNEGETTAGVKSILTFPAGFAGSVALAPAPISGFPGGSVTSGTPNTSTYNRPAAGQQPLTVIGSWEVRKSGELCASNSASVSITPLSPPPPPPPPTCSAINLNGSASVSGTTATITATWNGSGSTTVKLDNGTAQPISNGPPGVTYPGLASGNHSALLHYSQAGASCDKTVSFTIQEPPPPPRTCGDIHVVLQNPQVNGTSATCAGTWNAPPAAGTMFLDGGTPRTVASGAGTTYANLAAGSHTCKLDVMNGNEPCSASKLFTIEPPPPPRDCEDVKAKIACSVSNDDASCLVGWVNPGTGGIKLNNGPFEPVANGATKQYPNLSAGTYTATLKVEDGSLTCTDSDTFTVEGGPSCPPNQTTCNVTWTNLLESQFGNNPKCSDFGLQRLLKQESFPDPNSWETDRDASMVIVKDGACGTDANRYFAKKVTPNPNTKWIAAGLHVDFLCEATGQYKNLSHVELCGCPIGTGR